MKIVVGYPPIFERIAQVFERARMPGVIFTYGDTIFSPSGPDITPSIMEHEKVHSNRQGGDPLDWWDRYLVDVAFRLDEELAAHHVEYRAWVKRHGPSAKMLKFISGRLAGPLYGNMLTRDTAELAVLTGKLPEVAQ